MNRKRHFEESKPGRSGMKGTKRCKALALILTALLLMASFSACQLTPSVQPSDPSKIPGQWAENISTNPITRINSTMDVSSFDERFLAFISEHAEGNYMASPLSFRYALGLLLAGANGETKAELLKAFGVESEEEWNKYCLDFNGFSERYASGLEQAVRALRVANSVWKADWVTEDFKDAYREAIEKYYAAEYRSFTPADAVAKINEWADIKTEHMIQKLLPDDYPTESLAVVLMNALYFKDNWAKEFPKWRTKENDFHTLAGGTTRKEFMTTEERFSYYEDDETQLVILPMNGGVYMAFVLGSTDGLSEKISKAGGEQVLVTIPKIDLETDFSNGEFVDFLKANGVNLAFTDAADFSNMIDHDLYVSDIIQKTRIKLDEKGVEAAAVTAIIVPESAMPPEEGPKTFVADRPFSFYIYTTANDTTAILFAGQIVE
jgi:serpin B